MTTIGNVRDMQSVMLQNKTESLYVSTQDKTQDSNISAKENGTVTILLEDTLELSAEGLQLSKKIQEDKGSTLGQQLFEETQQMKETFKEAENHSKCMKIAMKLAAGEKIPVEDQKYLQKNDPEMYAQAMKVRIPKQDSEELEKRISKEDGQGSKVRELFNPDSDLFQRQINGSTSTIQVHIDS